jgi:hypothetical protein
MGKYVREEDHTIPTGRKRRRNLINILSDRPAKIGNRSAAGFSALVTILKLLKHSI